MIFFFFFFIQRILYKKTRKNKIQRNHMSIWHISTHQSWQKNLPAIRHRHRKPWRRTILSLLTKKKPEPNLFPSNNMCKGTCQLPSQLYSFPWSPKLCCDTFCRITQFQAKTSQVPTSFHGGLEGLSRVSLASTFILDPLIKRGKQTIFFSCFN